jgi:uncharacterized protein (TIGR00369 family)
MAEYRFRTDDLFQKMRQSPYHRWLGVELVQAESGHVVVRMPFREEFVGSDERTNIHGGIIATLADITACFVMMSSIGGDAPNLNLQVDYLRMVAPDTDLIATGTTIKAGRTVGVANVEIRTPDGRLVAVGRSTLVNNPAPREQLTKG